MYNTYFFSTATVVVRIRHIVMLQVHCLYRAMNEGRKNLHIVLNSKKFLYLHVYHQLLNDAISMCAFCLIDLCNYLRNNKTQDGSVCMYVCMYVLNSSVERACKILRIFRSDGYRRPFYRVTTRQLYLIESVHPPGHPVTADVLSEVQSR